MIRIYLPQKIAPGELEINDPDQYHYLCHVMRANVGQNIHIFNESDGEWQCRVTSRLKKSIIIDVVQCVRQVKQSPSLTLAFCLLKPDAMHMIFEKGTEIGVTTFMPLISDHTYIKKANVAKYQKVVVHASEQSERLDVPIIKEPISFHDFVRDHSNAWVAMERCDTSRQLAALKNASSPIITIGPEGGWSSLERDIIFEKLSHFSLGDRILRAETAAICSAAGILLR